MAQSPTGTLPRVLPRILLRHEAILALLLVLVACEPAEKRAEAHYQRALALLAEGDSARAAVEFRNVFRLDGDHTAARLAYARLLVRDGDREKAMGQYLRLAEQIVDELS